MRFYEFKTVPDGMTERIYAIVQLPSEGDVDVEVSAELKELLDDLQREFWRLEKREQRHTVHSEVIPECFMPDSVFALSPEEELINRQRARDVSRAFAQIPLKQQRRLVLRYIFDLPIKKIAKLEQCSERSIKYSLKLGKENLREILGNDFMLN